MTGFLDDILEEEENRKEEQSFSIFSKGQVLASAFFEFRRLGFPYWKLPLHICMQEINALASLPMEELAGTILGYHVADTYHPHRFHCCGMSGKSKSPDEAFMIDKSLERALNLRIKYSGNIPSSYFGELGLAGGAGVCSNFRPGFACYLYRKYCKKGFTVLDSSTGYGGRLTGFIASGIAGRYVGIDPSTDVYEGNRKLVEDLEFVEHTELLNLPIEDVELQKFKSVVDFAFTSPPYFSKEHYCDEPTQSFKRYRTVDLWINGFLRPMLIFNFYSLKPRSYMLINIADIKVDGVTYGLVNKVKEVSCGIGFLYQGKEVYRMRHRFGSRSNEVVEEPILIFYKGDGRGVKRRKLWIGTE